MGLFDPYPVFLARYEGLQKRCQRAVLFAAARRALGFSDGDWHDYAAQGGPTIAEAHILTDEEFYAVRGTGDVTVRLIREWLAAHPAPPPAPLPAWLAEE